MKKSKFIVLVVVTVVIGALVVLQHAKKNRQTSTEEENAAEVVTQPASETREPIDKNAAGVVTSPVSEAREPIYEDPGDMTVFSASINGHFVCLDDYETSVVEILGKPILEIIKSIEQFGIYSIKEVEYDGMTIEYARLGEDTPFFVDVIAVSKPSYATSRGIRIGDSMERVKKAYPFIREKVEQETATDMSLYIYNDVMKNIEFGFIDNILTKIRFYKDWP